MGKCRVLLVGSNLSVKGGIVTVLKNYLHYDKWENTELFFVPTHVETNIVMKLLYFITSLLRIIYTCFTKKIDIVHIHVSERGSFFRKAIIVLICKSLRKKVILHHHGAEFQIFYDNLSMKKKAYVRRILSKADLNIVLSNHLIAMITDIAPTARVQVLYNAVPSYDANPYNEEANGILFLGRLGKRKGTYDLLEVIQILDSQIDPAITFFLCGDGEVDEVQDTIDRLGIRDRIGHVGWVGKKEKKLILQQTMINVLPSYNEGLPMTILETMACGIPNISTCIASIPEVIEEGKTGLLMKPGDIKNFTKQLSTLISNKNLRKTISENSYRFINESFSLSKHISKLEQIYKQLR